MGVRLRDHNPPKDHLSDASAAFQSAVDAAFRDDHPEIELESRRYRIDNSIVYPAVSSSQVRRFRLRGMGAHVELFGAGTTFIDRRHTVLADADTRFWVPHISDLTLWGSNNESHGIRWWTATMPKFENVSMSNLDIGIEGLFCMFSKFSLCNAINCNQGFAAISGDGRLSDGNRSNSNSNVTQFSHCRAFGNSLSQVGFYIEQAGRWRVEQCGVEGPDMGVGLWVKGATPDGQQSFRSGTVDGFWFETETNLTTGMFFDQLQQSLVDIKGLNISGKLSDSLQSVLIDARGSSRSTFSVEQGAWQGIIANLNPAARLFADDSGAGNNSNNWMFKANTNSHNSSTAASTHGPLTTPRRWLNDEVPIYASEEETFGYG